MPRTHSSEIASRIVGDEIRGARCAVGLSQTALAQRLEVDPSYITNIEAGRRNLTVGQLAKIADALGTGLEVRLPVVGRERLRLSQARNPGGKSKLHR